MSLKESEFSGHRLSQKAAHGAGVLSPIFFGGQPRCESSSRSTLTSARLWLDTYGVLVGWFLTINQTQLETHCLKGMLMSCRTAVTSYVLWNTSIQ